MDGNRLNGWFTLSLVAVLLMFNIQFYIDSMRIAKLEKEINALQGKVGHLLAKKE